MKAVFVVYPIVFSESKRESFSVFFFCKKSKKFKLGKFLVARWEYFC